MSVPVKWNFFEQLFTSSNNVPKQGPPTEGKNEVEMTPAEGIAAAVLEIIRLEGELNRARARLAVCRAEERASEKKRLAQLRNLDISSIEATGDSQPTSFQDLGASLLSESHRVVGVVFWFQWEERCRPHVVSGGS